MAFDLLRNSNERLLIDALQPIFPEDIDIQHLLAETSLTEPMVEDWTNFLDLRDILHKDLYALTEVNIRTLFTDIPEPLEQPTLNEEFDGLDQFLENWLSE